MKRFRSYVLTAFGFAVLAIVAGGFSGGRAIAQAVRAALVSNVDDPGRIPYNGHLICQFQANTAGCSVTGSPVPAGKRLVVAHVSGLVEGNLPGGSLILPWMGGGGGLAVIYFPVTFAGSNGALNYFVFDQQILRVYDSGQQPGFAVQLSTIPSAAFAEFSMTGYMLDCTTAPCSAIAVQ